MRYFVRHPTTQAMPRKVKTAFAANDADNAITGIHDMAFIPRERDGVRGVEVRVGGGTSIMPRIAPTLYEFVELDNGDYLKVTEACMRIFDRQDFLRVNRARARIKVLVDKIGIDAFRELVEEELKATGSPSATSRSRRSATTSTRRPPRPGGRAPTPAPTETAASSIASADQRRPPAPAGLHHRRGQGPPRRPQPEQLRGLGQILRDYTGGYAKVAALEAGLSDVDAWVTGLRREQGPTRAGTGKLERDERRGIWKVSPLADWTEKQLWAYIFEHELPYHPLHDEGYASIGCAPCTLPGSGREGRWSGEDKTECGIHVIEPSA